MSQSCKTGQEPVTAPFRLFLFTVSRRAGSLRLQGRWTLICPEEEARLLVDLAGVLESRRTGVILAPGMCSMIRG